MDAEPGSAIEAEGDGALSGVGDTVERIGHVEDVGFGITGSGFQRHLGDGGGIVQGLAADGDGVVSDHGSFIDFATDCWSGTSDSATASTARGSCGGCCRCTLGGGARCCGVGMR